MKDADLLEGLPRDEIMCYSEEGGGEDDQVLRWGWGG